MRNKKLEQMKQPIIIFLALIAFTATFGQKTNNKALVIIKAENEIKFDDAPELNIARFGFGYTSDDNFLYVSNGGSSDSQFLSSIERYNQSTNTWEFLNGGFINKRYGCLELINEKLFIFNGSTSTSKNNVLEVYDLKENKLEVKKGSPNPVSFAGSATWKGEIYTFGGSTGKYYSNRLYKYNPKSDSWTKLAKMKVKMQTQGEIINGKLYTIGGYNGKSSNKIYEYDIATNSWNHFADLPITISAHSTTVFEDKIWIVGDYEKLSFLAYFDPKSKEFKSYNSDMEGRRHSGCAILNNKLMIFGGNKTSKGSSLLKSVQIFQL